MTRSLSEPKTHPTINPSRIVAQQPHGDFAAPHGRERLTRPSARAA